MTDFFQPEDDEEEINTNADFWNWFEKNEQEFFKVMKEGNNPKENFLGKVLPKLAELNKRISLVTRMYDDNTVHLIFTAEGSIKNIVLIESLVAVAPPIAGWKFTALKPALGREDVEMRIGGYNFTYNNLHFYANDLDLYPDEIDIIVVHDDLTEENKQVITSGSYAFLDNLLGELAFAETIDNLQFTTRNAAEKELIPIEKLKGFLSWRQKEFIERYDDVWHSIEDDTYRVIEGTTVRGKQLSATINSDLLQWDSKTSHPWMLLVVIHYDGSNNNGMPEKILHPLLDEIENKIKDELKDVEGYLNIGRQTSDNKRELFFACKDFRKPVLFIEAIQKEYAHEIEMTYEMYKDKYWQSYNHFMPTL